MTIKEINNAVKGTLYINSKEHNINIKGISIDSRTLTKGDLYIPIKGENFDGHDFIEHAIKNGALACLTENEENIRENINIILVNNTLKALHDLALYYRKKFDIPFIAITGSSGKTTTKDMLASVLEQKYNVLKTQGNFNNEIGLPLTLFQLEDQHEMAIIEMGMSNLGEIKRLVNMVFPDIAVITNVGLTHIENLGSQENIFNAKKEILDTLKKGQLALLNGDDKYLNTIKDDKFKVALVGIEGTYLDLKAKDIIRKENNINFTIENENKKIEEYHLNLPGIHNIYNSLFAIYIGKYFALNYKEIQVGLNKFKPSKMRMDISENGKIKIINDAYNANPDSMKAALNALKDSGSNRRKIAILGDMLEMGKWAEEAHFNIGKILTELKIDILLSVGKNAQFYVNGAVSNGLLKDNAKSFKSNDEAIQYLNSIIRDGDVLLIKGSRGMKMEEIAIFLQERC
jgi:UDP-N-acetylmuramoyl-tripeptide--D-alanyl-D-alanine ligase